MSMLAEHKNVHKHVRESVISIACSINPKMFTSMFKGRASMLDDPKMLTNMGYSQVSMLDEHKNMLANIFWVHRACSSDPRIFLRSSNMLANIFWSTIMLAGCLIPDDVCKHFQEKYKILFRIIYTNPMKYLLWEWDENTTPVLYRNKN